MYCSKCGKELVDTAVICPGCGTPTPLYNQQAAQSQPSQQVNVVVNQSDKVAVGMKNKWVTLVLCVLLGVFGVHRFYVGKIGTGLIWLFTIGVFGFGWIVDVVMIATGSFVDVYGNRLSE